MNLVIGATGQLGSAICLRLREQGKPVRALVRTTSDPAKVDRLRDAGVEITTGDLTDAASLARACAGVRTVLSTATVIASQQPTDSFAAVDDAGQKALIDAARAAGVDHFIFVSVSPNLTVSCPLIDAKREVERYLASGGPSYTVLQCSAFMEVWLGPLTGFDHENRAARLLGTGEQQISYVSSADVLAFAAACVDNPAARNRMLPIGGPQAISPRAAVRVFEEVAGASYDVQTVPVEALRAQYEGAAHPAQKSFAGIMLSLAGDDDIPMAAAAREFEIRQTSVRDFAQRARTVSH